VPGTVLIPKRAMIEWHGQPAAWVVTRGTASHRAITVGAERLDQVEITSGVMPGDTVILNPPPTLTDGAPVHVKGS
jgi:multidrug efflux pump subunit AcrA (membrane-fusion protein)